MKCPSISWGHPERIRMGKEACHSIVGSLCNSILQSGMHNTIDRDNKASPSAQSGIDLTLSKAEYGRDLPTSVQIKLFMPFPTLCSMWFAHRCAFQGFMANCIDLYCIRQGRRTWLLTARIAPSSTRQFGGRDVHSGWGTWAAKCQAIRPPDVAITNIEHCLPCLHIDGELASTAFKFPYVMQQFSKTIPNSIAHIQM